jgi:hypothetical protein
LRYDQTSRLKHLLLGALWSGISAMTKGIFTLITIGSGWVILCIYQGRWKEFFSLKWLLALMLTMLAMTPELWALYQQFDLHPEKVVFGHTHVSGVKFFFWDSQFGRFFNTGPITGGDARDVLYYVHVFLWSFMPWSWAFGWGVWCAAKRWQTMEPIERQAWVFLLAAFFVSFVMFSATSFQLDYYTVIVYPFASIVCAQAIVQGQLAGGDAWMRWGNLTYAFLMLVGASALTWYLQVDLITWVGSLGVLTMIVMVYALRQHASWMMLVIIPALAANLFYGVSEIMTYVVFDRYSLTNQLQQVLKDEPKLPVYFHDIDPVVSMEMQLYRSVASADLARMTQPIESNHYHLVLRQDKVATWTSQNAMKLIAQGCWMEHKTGLLPRTLRILKGQEPCEVYEVFEVTQP